MIRGLVNTTEITTLGIDAIRIDGGTQMRAALDDATVQEYTAVMLEHKGWGPFPPVVAFYDGDTYWLGDGFHRIAAMKHLVLIDRKIKGAVPAEVRPGTRRNAILHAAQANAAHGLRRTNADKQRAVATLLQDEEWAKWSDREIARRCAVSDRFVNKLRSELTANRSQSEPQERTYTTRHGTTATMNTEKIGAKPAPLTVEECEAVIWKELKRKATGALEDRLAWISEHSAPGYYVERGIIREGREIDALVFGEAAKAVWGEIKGKIEERNAQRAATKRVEYISDIEPVPGHSATTTLAEDNQAWGQASRDGWILTWQQGEVPVLENRRLGVSVEVEGDRDALAYIRSRAWEQEEPAADEDGPWVDVDMLEHIMIRLADQLGKPRMHITYDREEKLFSVYAHKIGYPMGDNSYETLREAVEKASIL